MRLSLRPGVSIIPPSRTPDDFRISEKMRIFAERKSGTKIYHFFPVFTNAALHVSALMMWYI